MQRRQDSLFFPVLVVFGLAALAFWTWQLRAVVLSETEAIAVSETAPTGYPGPIAPTPTVVFPTETAAPPTVLPPLPPCRIELSGSQTHQDVSLNSVTFGEPQVVFASRAFRVEAVQWLSDNQRLLIKQEGTEGYQIELLEVAAGRAETYAQGHILGGTALPV